MNKRIRELIEQATIRGVEYLAGNDGHPTPTIYFDKEKFANLLIQECVDQQLAMAAEHATPVPGYEPAFPDFLEGTIYGLKVGAAHIKEHFGVNK